MSKSNSPEGEPPSQLTDATTGELESWRDSALLLIRRLIKQADPEAVEEPKWRKPSNPAGVPVWSYHGMICTGETYKDHVRPQAVNATALRMPETASSVLEGTEALLDDVARVNPDRPHVLLGVRA